MINKNFTFLWMGKIISQLGDKFYAIALAWWILQKTNSPSIMGFFLLVSVLPEILIGFFAGAFTDRWKRKTMLVITDMIRGCLVLVISYLAMENMLEVWHVFVIGICLSIVTAFFTPAMQAIIPEIVEEKNLIKANGMSQMVSGICTVAGPLLGAITVSKIGLTWVFLANGISYYVSALLACFIYTNEYYRKTNEKTSIWNEVREGIHFIKNRRRIILVLKVIAMAHLFIGGLTVSLPFLANELNGKGVNNLGYLEMMLGIGLLAGSIYMSIKKKAIVNERILLSFVMIVGSCFLIISISQYLRLEAVYYYMPILMLIGICIAVASVFWQSLLQNDTPSQMTGRVFSISTLIGNTSLPIGYGVFGILLNISSIMIVMGVSGFCIVLLCFYQIKLRIVEK